MISACEGGATVLQLYESTLLPKSLRTCASVVLPGVHMDSYTLVATAATIVAGTVTFLVLRSGSRKKSKEVAVWKDEPSSAPRASLEGLEEFSYAKLK